MPAAEGPNTYFSLTNQLQTWKGNSGTQPPDTANNLKSDPSTPGVTYAYDARNLLNGISTSNGTTTYNYDAAGRRESVTSGATTTKYLYDGNTPVSAGAVSMVSLPGSNEIISTNGLVPIHDALGTTLAIVNSSGAIATRYNYDPFGNVTPGSSGYGTTFGMGGIELDPTGLYHAGARTYHPTLQRFLSEDPTGYGGGDINLFAYAGSDPVGASDPSGLDYCPGGDCGGDPNPPGGVPDIFYLYFFNGSSSSGPAVWDTFTHLWEKAQLAGSLQSTGVTVSDGSEVFGQGGTQLAAITIKVPPGTDPQAFADDLAWSLAPIPLAIEDEFGERALQSRAAHNAEQRTVRAIAKELGLGPKDWDRLHDAIGWAQEEGKLGYQDLLKEVRKYFPEK